MQTVKLNNGIDMPMLALAVGNEEAVGNAIKWSGVPRAELGHQSAPLPNLPLALQSRPASVRWSCLSPT
jgi:hypothetical protein